MVRTRFGEHVGDLRVGVVAEASLSVYPVDSIERDEEGQASIEVIIRWRLADNSHCGIETSTDNLVTNLAVRNDTVLKSLIEPSARHFNWGITSG